ncbi:hypothetical protein HYC85_030656 [Camellia sinensis]|uniref:Peptidyl-prolyl cis-trans isomerase n=1 Tax=Camellia sinensis TaxID=4442 RepID=A0A7J7G2E6_CAMSI|nr:hypothetical protein HYC85_030656 [Camellia sinensis]
MCKDSKPKESGGKGKGKQATGGSDDTTSKARHILCEKRGKINEAYKKLEKMAGVVMKTRFHLLSLQRTQNVFRWKMFFAETKERKKMVQLAAEYSECPSRKKGGDLGWFLRGKTAGLFQDVAFSTTVGATSAPFKSTNGYHIILS